MNGSLGIDTSNYTTSTAFFGDDGVVRQNKLLLPVAEGQLGLRQSDAVFHHIQQLPVVMKRLFEQGDFSPRVIGVSVRPRPIDGSYMPCFEAGRSAAEQLSTVLGIPVRTFSHQEGHIAAAMYSAKCADAVGRRFIAFHVSGGTTEAVVVERNDDNTMNIELAARSLDLKAGQAIDRVAGMLGLGFPGGAKLDELAQSCGEKIRVRPTMKGADCCLSGLENRCQKLISEGRPKEYIARFCIEYVAASLAAMCGALREQCGELPVLFAGGVSSNSIIREKIRGEFGAYFAAPEFSCDNAAGIALLAAGAI